MAPSSNPANTPLPDSNTPVVEENRTTAPHSDLDEARPPNWSMPAVFIFGVLSIAVLLIIIIRFNPSPTPTSWFVQLTVLALAGACIAALLPGAIRFQIPGMIKAAGSLGVFALIFYFGCRVNGLKAIAPGEDITGDWNYKCIALDKDHPNYAHGGIAHIDMRMTEYGPQWHLAGTRQWEMRDGKRFDLPNWQWETDWAAVTDTHRIKYTYQVSAEVGIIIGYADGTIQDDKDGKPITVSGKFWQVPPVDEMYGSYEFTRP